MQFLLSQTERNELKKDEMETFLSKLLIKRLFSSKKEEKGGVNEKVKGKSVRDILNCSQEKQKRINWINM
jgi:hypothetical protein